MTERVKKQLVRLRNFVHHTETVVSVSLHRHREDQPAVSLAAQVGRWTISLRLVGPPMCKFPIVKVEHHHTEFGSGLVVNLIEFAHHLDNDLARQIHLSYLWVSKYNRDWEQIRNHDVSITNAAQWFERSNMIWGTPERTLSEMIELWANGASDHLYEIHVPLWMRFVHPVLSRRIKELKDAVAQLREEGLEIGHGFNTQMTWKIENFLKLYELTLHIGNLLDSLLLTRSDKGQYQ